MLFAVLEHALTLSHDPSAHAALDINCTFPNYVVKLQANDSAPDPSG